jgi:hypothetical protein
MCALPKLAILILTLLPKPDAAAGWAWREQPRTYAPDTLYEYINGAADLYLSYGFEEVAVANYVKGEGDEGWITVDVYDMGAPLHAFGIYGSEMPPDVQPFPAGVQGYVSEGLIAFWRGDYYVKVMLIDGEDMEAARALARAAAECLPGAVEMPAELKRLPIGGRIAGSERYVKTSALGHRSLVEVVSAEYMVGETTATLHTADLGAPERAAEGWRKLRDFEQGSGEGLAEVAGVGEDAFGATDAYYGEMVAARQGRFLAIAMSETAARAELAELARTGIVALQSPPEEQCEGVTACAAPAQ